MPNKGNYRHGHRGGKGHQQKSPTYHSWASMRTRCGNPNELGWYLYGGRGITRCDRWSRFANFLADMGEQPPGTSLDRIDGNGNYEPSNCRWATPMQQTHNRVAHDMTKHIEARRRHSANREIYKKRERERKKSQKNLP
jgi:hypothetical protein